MTRLSRKSTVKPSAPGAEGTQTSGVKTARAPRVEVAPAARGSSKRALVSFHNATELSTTRLESLCREAMDGWSIGTLDVRVRYSRGADFSGRCHYTNQRIFVNLGRHVTYPYAMRTYVARAKTVGRRWMKPLYTLDMNDGYELVAFIFMHELYHLLVKRSRRNTRQKESMCDRFAVRYMVERFGSVVRDDRGRAVPREEWDFQDLERFVAAARLRSAVPRVAPVVERSPQKIAAMHAPHSPVVRLCEQLSLFSGM